MATQALTETGRVDIQLMTIHKIAYPLILKQEVGTTPAVIHNNVLFVSCMLNALFIQ